MIQDREKQLAERLTGRGGGLGYVLVDLDVGVGADLGGGCRWPGMDYVRLGCGSWKRYTCHGNFPSPRSPPASKAPGAIYVRSAGRPMGRFG